MHPVMSDSTLFILETEARQAREAALRTAMANAPATASPIGSLLARLARALWRAADPRGFALAQTRSRADAVSAGDAAPPILPPGWTPGSGEWPDTFAYSPAGMGAGQRTKGTHPVSAPTATALELVRMDSHAAEVLAWEMVSGGVAPIEIREAEPSERISA